MADRICPPCLDSETIVPISCQTTAVFKTGSWTAVRPRFVAKTSPCRAAFPFILCDGPAMRLIIIFPALALLDEPLAGFNPAETETIMAVIQDIRSLRGISIIWIGHKMECEAVRVRLHFGAGRPMSRHDFTKCGHLAVTAPDRYRAARMEHTTVGWIDGAGNFALYS